jgi:hypothetical protein
VVTHSLADLVVQDRVRYVTKARAVFLSLPGFVKAHNSAFVCMCVYLEVYRYWGVGGRPVCDWRTFVHRLLKGF